jgi:hypothetical protein
MPNLKRPAALVLLLLPFCLGFSKAGESHVSPLTDLLGKTVNFVILFGGLGFLLAKPLRRFLTEMGLAVAETIKDTEKAKKRRRRSGEKRKGKDHGSRPAGIREDQVVRGPGDRSSCPSRAG